MANISAKEVMKLRNQTGLPMMACKKALVEAGGDIDKAEELLRKQLKGKMEKRTDRVAGEGCVTVAINDEQTEAVLIEVRSETDFTAKNDRFRTGAASIADLALAHAPAGPFDAVEGMTPIIDDLRIATGENCSFARGHKLIGTAGTTAFGSYIHHDKKTGVLIQTEGSISEETLKKLCMHIAAAFPRPMGVTPDDIPADLVQKERQFRIDQAIESGKNQEIAEMMVKGGMRKFFSEVALVEQPFVMDTAIKIKDVVGPEARIIGFVRWTVGEES